MRISVRRQHCKLVRFDRPAGIAASIDRDFHTLLDSLALYRLIADPAVVQHVETVKSSVERGIRLSGGLRKMIDAKR